MEFSRKISGNGPSLFAVFRDGEEGPFLDFVDRTYGYYIHTSANV